jgi:hypothetical protein
MAADSEWKETRHSVVAHPPPPVNDDASTDSTETSPGVKRIELINQQFGLWGRVAMFSGIWLIAYVYGLDGTVRYTYQVFFLRQLPALLHARPMLTMMFLCSLMRPQTTVIIACCRRSPSCVR